MGQTRGSNSAGQGSLAAPSLNPSFLSHWDSDKGISRQAWTPHPIPRLGDLALLCWGAEGRKGHGGEVSRRSQKRRDRGCPPSGLRAAAPERSGQWDRAPSRASGRKGAQGSARVPRPAEATYVCCWGKL